MKSRHLIRSPKWRKILLVAFYVWWFGLLFFVIMTIARDMISDASSANAEVRGVVVDEVVSVYDGDTFFANIKDWPDIIGKRIGIRVSGVDTPEIRGAKCESERMLALQVRDFVQETLENAGAIELRDIKRGKYFRIAADVYVDGVNLSSILLAKTLNGQGIAVVYGRYNKKVKDWCVLKEK